jgi:hypothetical protein
VAESQVRVSTAIVDGVPEFFTNWALDELGIHYLPVLVIEHVPVASSLMFLVLAAFGILILLATAPPHGSAPLAWVSYA